MQYSLACFEVSGTPEAEEEAEDRFRAAQGVGFRGISRCLLMMKVCMDL